MKQVLLLLGLLLCRAALAASLVPLPEREFSALGLRAESRLQLRADGPMRVEFHRRQGFRWQGEGGRTAALLSLMVLPEGAAPRCLLVIEQGGGLDLVDALAGDAGQPWSCDGEPALGQADVDGDGVADLLALYPYRPPSGERFMLPLVFTYRPAAGRFELDASRTASLRTARRLPGTLKELKGRLGAR